MDLEEMVFQIEDPLLDEELRDDLISKLNIYGYSEERVENAAEAYWSSYFEQNMSLILSEQPELMSHLLDSEKLRELFDIKFEEYCNLKKDLGVDDIRKYWFPM